MKIIGAGCRTEHDENFFIRRPHGYGDYLFLLMRTESFHVIEGKKVTVPADTAILYRENTFQHYGAVNGRYIDDWVHFHASKEEAAQWEAAGVTTDRLTVLEDAEYFSSIIRNINIELYSANANRTVTCELYLRILLNKLGDRAAAGDRISDNMYEELNALRADIYNMPQLSWSIADMAAQTGLSQSYFQHLYRKTFGISAINDVIMSRIDRSKVLLAGTDLPIRIIAEQCGYRYDIFFMRQFKAKTGMTAHEYRKKQEIRRFERI